MTLGERARQAAYAHKAAERKKAEEAARGRASIDAAVVTHWKLELARLVMEAAARGETQKSVLVNDVSTEAASALREHFRHEGVNVSLVRDWSGHADWLVADWSDGDAMRGHGPCG